MLETYENYRSWFVGGGNSFNPDKGLTILLSKGMKAWATAGTNPLHSDPVPSVISSVDRDSSLPSELVSLLATVIGG